MTFGHIEHDTRVITHDFCSDDTLFMTFDHMTHDIKSHVTAKLELRVLLHQLDVQGELVALVRVDEEFGVEGHVHLH